MPQHTTSEPDQDTMTHAQDLDPVYAYYTAARDAGPGGATIYGIWEKGGAFLDSVTPSTYVPEYRSHMALKLLSLTGENGRIFSLGCGNGFVEGDLVRQHRTVRAIDVNEEAVALSREKGVDAFTADFYELRPGDLAATDAVYADGFLGHLFDAQAHLDPVLAKLAKLGLASGTALVFSNDAPQDRHAPFAPHGSVAGFWFMTHQFVSEQLAAAGFEPAESYSFPYVRPVSGLRNRTICVARVP